MTSDRWEQVQRLYHAALERSWSERAAFLVDACAGDQALRREVEFLLDNPASTVWFDKIVGAAAAHVLDQPVSPSVTSTVAGARTGSSRVTPALAPRWLD